MKISDTMKEKIERSAVTLEALFVRMPKCRKHRRCRWYQGWLEELPMFSGQMYLPIKPSGTVATRRCPCFSCERYEEAVKDASA